MKIEVGKYYRTRDGRKVGPMRAFCGKDFDIDDERNPHGDEVNDSWWRASGKRGAYYEDSDLDLIAEWAEDNDLNAICDERQGGPFVSASDTPKTWDDEEGWSEWTSDADWDTSKVDVQMECIDGIHRTRTRPRKPVRETVTLYGGAGYGLGYEFDRNLTEHCSHRLTFTTTDGKPATGTFTNENGDVITMEEV